MCYQPSVLIPNTLSFGVVTGVASSVCNATKPYCFCTFTYCVTIGYVDHFGSGRQDMRMESEQMELAEDSVPAWS